MIKPPSSPSSRAAGTVSYMSLLRDSPPPSPHPAGRQHSLLTRLVKGSTIGARNSPNTAEPLPAPSFCFNFGAASSAATEGPSASSPPGQISVDPHPGQISVDPAPGQISVVFAKDVGAAIAALLATPRDALFAPTLGGGARFLPTADGAPFAPTASAASAALVDAPTATSAAGTPASASPAPARPPRGISLHICQRETPSWPELVHGLADALRGCGVTVPEPALDPNIDTRFLSVDFGALDSGEARRRLLGWEPAPLAQRMAVTAKWWVEEMWASFEEKAAAEVSAGGEGGGRPKRRCAAQRAE